MSFWEFPSLFLIRKWILKFKFLCSVAERMNFKIYLMLIYCFLFGIYGYPIYQGFIPTIKYFVLSSREPYIDKDETILSFPRKRLRFVEFPSLLFIRNLIPKFKLLCSVAEKINFKLHLLKLHACFFGIRGYPIHQGVNSWIKSFVVSSRKPYYDMDETILYIPWKRLSLWEFSSLLFIRKFIMKFNLLCPVAERMYFKIYQLLILFYFRNLRLSYLPGCHSLHKIFCALQQKALFQQGWNDPFFFIKMIEFLRIPFFAFHPKVNSEI